MNAIGSLFVLIMLTAFSNALECYVCQDQEHNSGKCKQTIKTCEQSDDMCLTEIVWGTMPYWSQGANKQYFVSKDCATRNQCDKAKNKFMTTCSHIWYQDWKCVECCAGDRCNYFVILSGSTARSNITLLVSGLVSIFVARRFFM